jgi:hypothetical protein
MFNLSKDDDGFGNSGQAFEADLDAIMETDSGITEEEDDQED